MQQSLMDMSVKGNELTFKRGKDLMILKLERSCIFRLEYKMNSIHFQWS